MHYMGEGAIGLRQRRRAEIASKLIRSARRHTAEDGLSGFTVEALCEEASISRRTFFNYFASKDDAVLGIPSRRSDVEAVSAFKAGGSLAGHEISPTLLADLVTLWSARWAQFDLERETASVLAVAVQREPRLVARMLEHLALQEREDVALVCEREGLPADDLRAAAAVQLVDAIARAATMEYLSQQDGGDSVIEIFERRIGAARELFFTQVDQ